MRRSAFNLCAGLAAGLMLVGAQPAQAISVEIQGTPAAVVTGDAFSVDIVITGIVDEIITAWDIDVTFNSPLLTAFAPTLYPMQFGGFVDTIFGGDLLPGMADVWLVSLLSDADIRALQCPADVCAPSLTIARLVFEATADGVPEISLVNWGLANDIKCADNFQCYPRREVPEPGSLALLGLGLLGLAARRRRAA